MSDSETPVGRRSVLQGSVIAVVAGAAGFIAYSARDDESPALAYPAAGGSGTDGQGGSAAETLASAADVPAGGGVVVADKQIVLTRDAHGAVRGFSAVCTHQGCQVSEVQDGMIVCPCHGSRFDAVTGEVRSGPATASLPEIPVQESDGVITAG